LSFKSGELSYSTDIAEAESTFFCISFHQILATVQGLIIAIAELDKIVRQVYTGFSLDRVQFRQVYTGFSLFRVQFRQVYTGFSLFRVQFRQVYTVFSLFRVQIRQVYTGFK
jgi:hypothetical protein